VRQLERALRELSSWGPIRCSSFYRSEPLGDPGQPWYVNAVAELETSETATNLLGRLKRLERLAGRPEGGPRWAPRVLDLDLLLLGDLILNTPDLKLPHACFHMRRFVLEPLEELAPEVRDPRSGRSVQELLLALDDPLRVEKLSRTLLAQAG
jgi:2-amino-4-hydroxy-6-hydroxymethyldihydropteridine diphosphokinase